MADRHALLIGVPHYDDKDFNKPRLADAVCSDIGAMHAALEQSGYVITGRGTADAERGWATPNRIIAAIEDACANVSPGGVLLIYFSGHGLTINGRDYLVPTDSRSPGGSREAGQPAPSPSVRSLVPVVPDLDVLAACRAALVVFFVDACRNEWAGNGLTGNEPAASGLVGNGHGPAGAPRSVEPGGQQPYLADGGQFVLVMGCGPGQVCQYKETGSAFTEALAKVLDPLNPARTLAEVVAEVTRDMERRSRQTEGIAQVPAVRNPTMLKLAGDVQVCDGDKLTDAWRKSVEYSPLLALCPDPDLVRAVVAECARRCGEASATLEAKTRQPVPVTAQDSRSGGPQSATPQAKAGLTDPWTDQDYPSRVLRNAEMLLLHAGLLPAEAPVAERASAGQFTGPVAVSAASIEASRANDPLALRPEEAALLIAAPFLREAVLAVGIRDAAAIDPANLDRTFEIGNRADLELTHEMHQHLVRRAVGLRQRALTGSGGVETGRADGVAGGNEPAEAPPGDRLAMWLVHQWLAGRARLWEEPGSHEVYALARPLITDLPGRAGEGEVPSLVQVLLQAVGAQPTDERLLNNLKGARYVDDGWRTVAAVLWLAGIMGADPRRLPPVVPDLVGTGMELALKDVRDAAGRQAKWEWGRDSVVDLGLVCEHPALHDSFEDVVARADKAAETIGSGLGLPRALNDRLPRGFTSKGLRPETRLGEDLYEVPLSRFQIAEEKVRELLMGRQLYGDPKLAIRELYQNALDACRWRATRQEYLTRTAKNPARWEGRIRFEQGTDAGRPYIECEDNGVGMDINTLKHVFANAGERFVYGQEFRAEQADWANENPPLRMVSNSQFGVGVFSYFMLADEITVRTRHQRRTGAVEWKTYEVRIASSGSLIQISPVDDHDLRDGGTKVRLYLSGDAVGVSVLDTLRDLLWIAEHRVEVTGPDGRETWAALELRYPSGIAEPLKCGSDLWWVLGRGGLAADGINTGKENFGLIVNLRDEHRPQFTVDRNTLRAWDEDWVTRQVSESLPDLMQWPGFTLSWLWKVAEDGGTAIAMQIFEYASATGKRVKIGETWGKATPVALRTMGCLPVDRGFTARISTYARWFDAWQTSLWRDLALIPISLSEVCIPETTEGFPVPDPVDAELLGRLDQGTDVPLPTEQILSSLGHGGHTIVSELRRLRKYAITGLDLSQARRVPPISTLIEDTDASLLPAVTILSAPGAPPDRNPAVPLAQASSNSNKRLSEVLHQVQAMAPDGWSLPQLELGELVNHTCTGSELALLSRDGDGAPPWVEGNLMPTHLAKAIEALVRPIAEVLEICDRLAPLGVTVASRDVYPRELETMELLALTHITVPGQAVSQLHVVSIAGQFAVSVGEAYRGLARLEELGFLVRPEFTGPLEFAPTTWDFDFIVQQLQDYTRRQYRDDTLTGSPFLRITGGILQKKDPVKEASARRLVPFTTPDRPLTLEEIVLVAGRFEVTLAESAVAFQDAYPEIQLPVLAAECANLTVPFDLFAALVGEDEGKVSWRLGPGDIVGGALDAWQQPLGDYLGRLDPFRRLGAPVPPYDESIHAALNQVELDRYHLDMLTVFNEFGDETHLRSVAALNLVQIAGRLGWTPAQAHARLAGLSPLGLTLDYPDAELSDELVRWQDLLLLTTYFDGQPPAVSGRVGRAYLEKAAEEIFDAPPEEIRAKADWLRERLKLYVSLFQLEVDPPDPEEHAVA